MPTTHPPRPSPVLSRALLALLIGTPDGHSQRLQLAGSSYMRGMGTLSGVMPWSRMNASVWSQKYWLIAGGPPHPS